MLKILVAVDGSESSGRAVEHLIVMLRDYREQPEVHLLNVQPPIPYGNRVSSVVGHDKIAQYHQEEGMATLGNTMKRLEGANIRYHYHIGIGSEAEVICQYAKQQGCSQIVMGTRGMSSVANLLLGSVATKVIHLSPVAVLLVK